MSKKIKIPSFLAFKRSIFDKLNKKEKNTLFYWSLMDPSTWEDIGTVQRNYYPKFLTTGKTQILSIFKKRRNFFNKYVKKDISKFYQVFVQSEYLTNYLLAATIEKELKNKFKGKIDKNNLEKTIFPDIIINVGKEFVAIEIKGLLSAANLAKRIKDEVLKGIKNGGIKYNKFLLLLLFPCCLRENPYRVNQLIEGNYFLQDFIKMKADKKIEKCRVLCRCQTKKGDDQYSLGELRDRLIKILS